MTPRPVAVRLLRMSKVDRVTRFMSEVGNSPYNNRRQGLSDRKRSLWMRIFALGFLIGLASSMAWWVYDRLVARAEATS